MSDLACGDVQDLAAELALGTLPGDHRAAVLRHLEGCPACAQVVEELSDVADAVLLLAPEVQPPSGFARRAVRSMARSRRRVSWRWAAVTAAAAVVLLVAGVALGLVTGHLPSGSVAVREASFVPAGQLGPPGSSGSGPDITSGQVYVRAGHPSWVFMIVKYSDGTAGPEGYSCELVLASGRHLWIGTFAMSDGTGSWGRSVGVPVSQIRSVNLLGPNGATVATATLAS